MSGVLAEGTLYFNQLVAGVSQGRVKWPGVAKLEIKPNSELIEQISKDKGQYGQISGSAAINKPADFSLTIADLTGSAMAMALQGTDAAYSQGSGTVTDEVVTAKLGKFIDLSKKNISETGFVVTNSDATVTYELDTDYRVNYAMGWLEVLPTGNITSDQALKVDFAYSAISGTKVKGGTLASVKGTLELDGNNLFDGTPLSVTIWEATLTADGAVDFMSDKPIELSMKGRMATPTGKDSPFEVVLSQIFS
jgi:hypothetical protein